MYVLGDREAYQFDVVAVKQTKSTTLKSIKRGMKSLIGESDMQRMKSAMPQFLAVCIHHFLFTELVQAIESAQAVRDDELQSRAIRNLRIMTKLRADFEQAHPRADFDQTSVQQVHNSLTISYCQRLTPLRIFHTHYINTALVLILHMIDFLIHTYVVVVYRDSLICTGVCIIK